MIRAIVLGLVVASPVAADGACEQALDAVAVTSVPSVGVGLPKDGIELGESFAISVVSCQGWDLRDVTAFMPAHGHGMNYVTELETHKDGAQATGLLFHMPGLWELRLELAKGDQRAQAVLDIPLLMQ